MHPILADARRLSLYLAAWLLVGCLLAILPGPGAGGTGAREAAAFALAVPLALLYAFVCLAAWYPCRANPLPSTPPRRLAVTHGAAALTAGGLWIGAGLAWARVLGRLPTTAGAGERFAAQMPLYFGVGVLLYLLAVALHYLALAFSESRAAEARALELRMLAREAELGALKAQIDPHFLFNSLNSIASLCGSDPGGARRMSLSLAEFLRASLRAGSRRAIPLAEELDLAGAYLAVEGIRFGPRLAVTLNVAPEARTVPVPPLLLQPLVENAVRHGIAHLVEGGEVRIEAALADGVLHLAVLNPCDPDRPAVAARGSESRAGGPRRTGPRGSGSRKAASRGAAARGGDARGLGLANVRRRLRLLHGGRARLEVEATPERFRAQIHLPVEAAAGPGGAG